MKERCELGEDSLKSGHHSNLVRVGCVSDGSQQEKNKECNNTNDDLWHEVLILFRTLPALAALA